ncbi:MAG TPA: hypothetical protein VK157_11780 [Phycisphaerales bacterium]|nr:hypothetical protein [Phycisphaerales bacterium]
MRPSRTPPPVDESKQGPYGRTFHFAGHFPLPMWMQHAIVIVGIILALALLPLLIALAIKNVSEGKPPLPSRTSPLSREVQRQREQSDPAIQAKQQFIAEQSNRPVLDISAYEQLATTDLINAINHAGPSTRTRVVRTLALSRNTALRLLPWCNTQLRTDDANEYAELIWTAAVKFSGCDPAQIPREQLYWRSALKLQGATPLSPQQQEIWSCVLDAATAEESAFRAALTKTQGPQ